ncbi:hypothetical protein LSAT2_028699 [Lamellibrachia satsuma]|nr:hypothetical protein LSAT2_028699 [Lamellibrachia satsuma]
MECHGDTYKDNDTRLVNCEWGTWSRWSDCTQPCGGGATTRIRSISTPKKENGEECIGDRNQTKSCNTDECPMCRDDANNVYELFQTVNETDCDICICNKDSVIECDVKSNANINGGWSAWGTWSDCSATCETGLKFRSRSCTNPTPNCAGLICQGNYTDQAPCGSGFTCPACTDLEEYVTYRCERTCENMTAESNTCLYGNEVFNDCACQNGFYRHNNGSCVPGDVCKLCIIDGKVMPPIWENPNEPCLKYSCVDGAVVTVDESASCTCQPGYIMIAPTPDKCCNCIPEGVPQMKCQLTTRKKTINVTDERGIACVAPPDFSLTTCSGSCESWDMSPVRFKDTGDEVSHIHECACCAGIGSYVDVDMLCGDVTRTVQVMQFTGCTCKVCVETTAGIAGVTKHPVPTTPAPATCVANTLNYDNKDEVMFVVMGSREVASDKDVALDIVHPPQDVALNIVHTPQDVALDIVHPPQDVALDIVHPPQDVALDIVHPPQDVALDIVHPPQDVALDIVHPPQDAPVYALANSGTIYRSHNTVKNPYLYINLPMNRRFIVRQVTLVTKKASDVKISVFDNTLTTGPVERTVSDLNTAISQTVSVVFDNYATTIRFDFTGSNVRVGSLEVVVTECTGERAWRVSWHLQVLLLQSSRTLTMTRTFRLKCQFLFYNDKEELRLWYPCLDRSTEKDLQQRMTNRTAMAHDISINVA